MAMSIGRRYYIDYTRLCLGPPPSMCLVLGHLDPGRSHVDPSAKSPCELCPAPAREKGCRRILEIAKILACLFSTFRNATTGCVLSL